jgi:NUDIX domain
VTAPANRAIDFEKIVEVRKRPNPAIGIGALVRSVEDHDADFPRTKAAMLFVEQVGNDQRRRQHAVLQRDDTGQLIRPQTALHIDEVSNVGAAVNDQQIGRIRLAAAAVGVEAERAISEGSFISTNSLAAYCRRTDHGEMGGEFQAGGICGLYRGRVLLVRQVSNTWSLPGGKVEHGEGPIDAVIERLLDVDSRVIPATERAVPGGPEHHNVGIYYLA